MDLLATRYPQYAEKISSTTSEDGFPVRVGSAYISLNNIACLDGHILHTFILYVHYRGTHMNSLHGKKQQPRFY